MALSRSANTMVESLPKLLQDLAIMKTMPDADIGWIVNIETQVLDYLRSHNPANGQMPMGGGTPNQPQGPPPGMGMPGMHPGAPGPPMPASPMGARLVGGPAGPPVGNPGPPMDEIARMLGGR